MLFKDTIIGIRTNAIDYNKNKDIKIANQTAGQQPPIITITTIEDEDAIDGMLDRISHDLDYLLNRTCEIPPPPPPAQRRSDTSTFSSTQHQQQNIIKHPTTCSNVLSGNLSVHEVIIEESEE